MKKWLVLEILFGVLAGFSVLYAVVGVLGVAKGNETTQTLSGEIIAAVFWTAIFFWARSKTSSHKLKRGQNRLD